MKPKWIHDCDQCKYLGSMFRGVDILDWYVCIDSLVARTGDRGSEYWSMSKRMVDDDRYLMSRDSENFYAISDMQVLAQHMMKRA